MKRPTASKILVADSPEELDQKVADASQRPPVQIDIEDYAAGGKLTLEGDAVTPAAPQIAAPTEDPIQILNEARAKVHEAQRNPTPGRILPDPASVRYESRIRIIDAWQYNGNLAEAPAYVDRSWAAWGEYDEERKLEPGPALRVPLEHGREVEKLCRKGDYIVRQEVVIALGVEPDVRLEVWRKDEFEKMFLPTRANAEPEGNAA